MDRSESPPRIVIRVATPDPSKSITRIDSNDSDDGDLALKPTKSLHQLLRESSIQHADERIGYFWSRKILSDIMTRERVAAALHHDCDGLDLANKFGGSISALRDFILESHVQVFALLLLGDRAADIVEFTDREGGVCDKDLPLDIQLQTGKPGLFRRDDATKRVKCFDVCQWRTMELEYFYEMQWRVAVPFLALSPENGNAVHYDLPPRAILPWTRDPQDQSSDREEREGGFGSVKRVKIDSSSHGFYEPIQQAQTSTVSDYFAVKTLHLRGNPERSKEDFRREVDALKRLSQGTNHGHLIRLLATYKQDEMYHLIFPWAERDLESYWEEYNGPLMSGRSNEDNMFWIAKQITGITSALAHIHNPGPVSSSNRKYGRHGDIKPSNILCFRTNVEDQKTLVLTDFGSTSLNSQLSRSNIPARYLPRSPTYRAPECDMEGGLISRSSDIWQLGCVLLEMAAWILGGWAEVDRFTKCRTTEEITDIRSDCFFQILHKDDKFSFEVKPQVTSYFTELHKHQQCTKYMHRLLELVEARMLLVTAPNLWGIKRAGADEVLNELERLLSKANSDVDFLMKPSPQDHSDSRLTQSPVELPYDLKKMTEAMRDEYRYSRAGMSHKFRRGLHRRTTTVRVREIRPVEPEARKMQETALGDTSTQRQEKRKNSEHEELGGKAQPLDPSATSFTQEVEEKVRLAYQGVSATDHLSTQILVDWELQRCIRDELDGDCDLGSVVTISGNSSHSWVATCREFVDTTWGAPGVLLLHILEDACRESLSDAGVPGLAKNANPNDINGISCVLGTADEELYNPPRLHFYGNLEDTIIFCQFISWIAAVFRLPVENQLSASSVDFSLDSARTLGNKPPDTHKASFRITTSLNDLQKVGDQEVGTCWTPLFPSMVMASGFPVPTTPGTKGLLIPFGQMLEMADVLYDINLEDKDGKLSGVYFDGVSYVLYPTRYIAEENTVQWHLKRKREHGAERNQAHAPDLGSDQRWLRGVDLETLSNAKAVLGYCGDVVVQLGTASRLAQFEKYRYSLASAESPPPEISLTGLTASINLKGFANLGGSATARYPKGHRVARDKEKKKEYTEVLEDAERQWVILFETSPGQERAWMVSQLSLILELFNFWAFKRGLKDTIKFAEPGPSGVSEAKAVLDDGTYASTIVVPKKIPSDTGLCIGDIVKRIFNRIESRITEGAGSSKGESDKGKIRLGRGGIAGWDWLELAGAPSISDMRGIPDFPEPCWMPFTKRVPIFMGQNLGQLLTPKDQATAKLCGNWQPIPGGIKNNYLVASVASIQKLAEHSGHDECWFFSENLAWEFRDHHLFEGCRDECIANPSKCRKMPQLLVKKKKRKTLTKPPPPGIAVQRARLQIKQHGAIVFATERKEGRW